MAPTRPSPPCGEARWGRQMAPTNHQNAVRTSTGTLDAPARRQSRQPPRLGPVDFLQYEAHHSPAERLEPSVAANVIRLFVHFTVDLNDQLRSTTWEVHDVRADRVLSPEFDSEPARAQPPPHSGFDACHVRAQVLGALDHGIFHNRTSFRPEAAPGEVRVLRRLQLPHLASPQGGEGLGADAPAKP